MLVAVQGIYTKCHKITCVAGLVPKQTDQQMVGLSSPNKTTSNHRYKDYEGLWDWPESTS
jgi:hypothetical protein